MPILRISALSLLGLLVQHSLPYNIALKKWNKNKCYMMWLGYTQGTSLRKCCSTLGETMFLLEFIHSDHHLPHGDIFLHASLMISLFV